MFKRKQKATASQIKALVNASKKCQGCIYKNKGNCFYATTCLDEARKFRAN